MNRHDYMTSDDIKAETQRLNEDRRRRDIAPAARDAAGEAIDRNLDELQRRDDLS